MGQASWAKVMLPGGKLTALVCHPTEKVNKAEELTYLSTNTGLVDVICHNMQYNDTLCNYFQCNRNQTNNIKRKGQFATLGIIFMLYVALILLC